ncbi:MAG: sulfurtransferase TusA family protein [Xanthomonadaceae bacterium]|nr:sulfurtransferase TusA family protein [Xanthomonadaceae bacterium]
MVGAEGFEVVDARGQPCPHPVLAARAALAGRAAGSRIVLLATDPLSPVDVAAWCARGGRRLLAESREGDTFRFVIEQG